MAHCGVTELSAEEQEALAEIRKRKEILLEEIQVKLIKKFMFRRKNTLF